MLSFWDTGREPFAFAFIVRDNKCGAPTTGNPKVFFKYFYVNTATGEKSGDVLMEGKLK